MSRLHVPRRAPGRPAAVAVIGGPDVTDHDPSGEAETIGDGVELQQLCFVKQSKNRDIYQVETLKPRVSRNKTNNLRQFGGETQEMLLKTLK